MITGVTEIKLTADQLKARCQTILKQGARMVMAYGWLPPQQANAEILYLANLGPDQFELWRCPLNPGETPPSLATLSPLLGWYEREMTDLMGITFLDQPEPYPLVLHEGAHVNPLPLMTSSKDDLLNYQPEPWHYPDITNPDLQRLPFGPVRADVVESAEFDYFYAGETIVHFDEKLFFKHRGMEKRFCGLKSDLGVVLAERISGIGSASHALAYCQAVESACGCEISERASYLRVITVELERLYNHLEYFGHLCSATTLKVAAAEGKLLAERLKQVNGRVTGNRFLRNMLIPGGMRRALKFDRLVEDLSSLKKEIDLYLNRLEKTKSHVDRLLNTGVVTQAMALAEGATGPVERAANVDHDLRRDHPYAIYPKLTFDIPVQTAGDAHARTQIRMAEVQTSFQIIFQAIEQLPKGDIYTTCEPKANAQALSWAESPRGGLFYGVHFDEQGLLLRVKVKSPSYSNWRVFPFTVQGTGIMDFAINEASFGLSTAGCDR